MTPAQLRALLDAATKRPWVGTQDPAKSMANHAAIVATMNAADALVALWEIATELADFTYSDSQAEAIERLGDVVRRLEELP